MKEGKEREKILKEIQKQVTSEEILDEILKVLSEKQAKDSSCYKIDKISTLADYMLIASASSSTHMKVLADEVHRAGRQAGYQQLNSGEPVDEDWSVLDFGTVIVHLFSRDSREHYQLDEIWSKGKTIDLTQWFEEEDRTDPS